VDIQNHVEKKLINNGLITMQSDKQQKTYYQRKRKQRKIYSGYEKNIQQQ
jgi:hypothetical protein